MPGPDRQLEVLNSFTTTSHGSTIPGNLELPGHTLPDDFTLLILGAGEGIGEHIAYQYARNLKSGTIIVCARRLPSLEKVKGEILSINSAVRVEIRTCDIASSGSVSDLAEFIQEHVRRLDCLIVNAAYAPPVLLKMHLDKPEDVQRAFDTNVMGTFHAAHFFTPLLLESPHGTKQFIAIGSLAGSIRRGHIANMGYCVSKMTQTKIVEYIQEQYGATDDGGLWAVTVHPGAVMTNMSRENTPDTFMPYLTDHVGLCGAFCTYLSKKVVADELRWMSGRFVSANWDIDELLAREGNITDKDLLKFTIDVE